MFISKKKYDTLVAEKDALADRILWMEVLLAEHEKFSQTKRLQNKLDKLNARYDEDLKRAPRHQAKDINEMNVDEWAREMKKAYPDNKFAWND